MRFEQFRHHDDHWNSGRDLHLYGDGILWNGCIAQPDRATDGTVDASNLITVWQRIDVWP